MRLKPGGVLLLLLIGAVIAYFIFKFTMTPAPVGTTTTSNTTTASTQDTSTANSRIGNSGNNTTTATADRREFNYTPEKPVNGTLRGVVEVGATGFNSFVINMDKQRRWEIVSKDFGESLAYEGLATTEDIRNGLKKYIAGMFDK